MVGSIYDWAVSPDSNQTADAAINWQEFQDPATVNNAARQMMARVSEWLKDIAPTRTSTGAVANTYNVAAPVQVWCAINEMMNPSGIDAVDGIEFEDTL